MNREHLTVAFDQTPAISGRTGIARYVAQLDNALQERGIQLRRFAVGRATSAAPRGTVRVPIPTRLAEPWWRVFPWPPLEQLIGRNDVVHATGLLMPRTRQPLVVTVHDIAGLRHPELHPPRHVRQQHAMLSALRRAAAVVTVSAATADDLAQLGIASERLVIAPLGLTALVAHGGPVNRAPEPGYLLTVGETSPRKGYGVLLRALSRAGKTLRLVMAGPPAADDLRLRSLASELGIASRVSFLGAVSDSTLAELYRGALALCFPSVSEGFGLPVLEAMAAGVPVLASDIPATRELAGGAAIYLPGKDGRAWADAIDGIVNEPRLRESLAAEGYRRAGGFTWRRTAEATIEAYRLAADGRV